MARASDELLDLPVTRERLHALAAADVLDEAELARALSEGGYRATRASWSRYLYRQALLVGVVLLVCGAIFFVAANWSALSGFARMGMVGGAMIAATLAGGWLGDSLAGRFASLLGGLLFGPLLAVYGQVYQTGADPWQLFAWWTAVLIGYAALVRFVGTWVFALLCLHVACFTWIDQELGVDPYGGVGAWIVTGLVLADALLVVLAERFAKQREREILAHVAAYFGLAVALPFGVLAMYGELSESGVAGLVVLVLGLAAIWLVYRWRRPALGMLAAFACVVTILVSVACARILLDGLEAELFGIAALGAVICLQVWGFTHWLLAWRREHALGQEVQS